MSSGPAGRPASPSDAGGAGRPTSPSGPPSAVAPATPEAPGLGTVTERVAGAVLTHPDVVRLSGGAFGAVATYLPGRRLLGVVLGEGDEPTRISVVLRLGAPVRPTAEALRRLVAAETGARRVDVVVTDVETPASDMGVAPSSSSDTTSTPTATAP